MSRGRGGERERERERGGGREREGGGREREGREGREGERERDQYVVDSRHSKFASPKQIFWNEIFFRNYALEKFLYVTHN